MKIMQNISLDCNGNLKGVTSLENTLGSRDPKYGNLPLKVILVLIILLIGIVIQAPTEKLMPFP